MEQKITLLNHRENLLKNHNRFLEDKERAIIKFAETAYKFYGNCGTNKKKIMPLLKNLGCLAFEAQESKPIYDYEDTLPRSWNSPSNGGWKVNYIKWEIGHLISSNNGGLNNPENLSFQSARCNQHIQTSLNYNETTEYNCKEEVQLRINKLFILHKSQEWGSIINKINKIIQ